MRVGLTPTGPLDGRRVAVTGIGALSCAGVGVDALWSALLRPEAPDSMAIAPFDASHLGGPKELRRLDPFTLYALMAADEAWRQSGLEGPLLDGGSVVTTGIGGLQTVLDQVGVLTSRGRDRVSPFMVPMMMPNAATAAVSMRFGLGGPAETVTTACAAGTHAVGNGARLVATGRCPVVLAGGAEAVIVEIAEAGFRNMTALSTRGVSRPFDVERDGFVMGEGAGVLVLEEWEHALARGAPTTTSSPTAGSIVVVPAVGGMTWWRRVRTDATASRAPAAAREWPRWPLIEVTGGAVSPKTARTATDSARSLSGVEVP